MISATEEILNKLIDTVSTLDEVQAIGMSGSKTPLPKAGEADIDIFIYCDKVPQYEQRQAVLNQLGDLINDAKINVFEGGNWGTGDFVLINGVETWLMYFSVNETLANVEAILNGDYPDKLDNYYYPVGRLAMLRNISILYEKSGFLSSLKERLSEYPDKLEGKLKEYHMGKLEDREDLERAVMRKDVLFYHFAIDIAIDHFLQALFAINKTFFPSRKRTLSLIENFEIKPNRCSEKLMEVIKLGSNPDSIRQSYDIWSELINELQNIAKV